MVLDVTTAVRVIPARLAGTLAREVVVVRARVIAVTLVITAVIPATVGRATTGGFTPT